MPLSGRISSNCFDEFLFDIRLFIFVFFSRSRGPSPSLHPPRYSSILISINYNHLYIIIHRLFNAPIRFTSTFAIYPCLSSFHAYVTFVDRAVDINIFFHSNFNVIVIVHRPTHFSIFLSLFIYILTQTPKYPIFYSEYQNKKEGKFRQGQTNVEFLYVSRRLKRKEGKSAIDIFWPRFRRDRPD